MTDIRNLTDEQLNDREASLRKQISEIQSALPYADGQAYYNDKRELNMLNRKLTEVNSEQQYRKGQRQVADRFGGKTL